MKKNYLTRSVKIREKISRSKIHKTSKFFSLKSLLRETEKVVNFYIVTRVCCDFFKACAKKLICKKTLTPIFRGEHL